MPIETNLNTSPYNDDYDPLKDFYRILFRPSVSVQARELNQLQTILQQQVERFGDHVFKSGTIVSGVNFQFNPRLDYVKILDNDVNGQPVIPSEYVGLFARNSSNLVSRIINYKTGFQARDPETNYLFLRYLNSGNTNLISAYSNSDVLTIYSDNYKLFDFTINNGGSSFSNTDTIQITSALIVANSNLASGGNASQTIGANTANVFIVESNTTFGAITVSGTTYTAADGFKILKIKPIVADLSNNSLNSLKWSISSGSSLVQGTNTATVVATIGSGARAILSTDGSGVINDINLQSAGSGYEVLPSVTVRSSTGVHSVLDLVAKNFKAQVTIADGTYTAGNSTPVGFGYGFGVTEGVIYQKGIFLRVDNQSIVVNSYSTNVDSTTVGFVSSETIVNNNTDSSLLDNATGTFNFAAPGAHRLKLTPELIVVPSANVAANSTFFPLAEFREGYAFKQNKSSVYNILAQEFERRTHETSGSFVIDPFVITTRDKEGDNWSNSSVDLVIDPGVAYIEGKRVQTDKNTLVTLRRSTTTNISEGQTISVNYGNYVMVDEFAGYFDFKSGTEIDLYDTPRNYITTSQTSITPTGNKIGTARIRSLVFDSGTPGSNTAKYRMYLFNSNLLQGKSFKDVRSVHFSNSNPGIADIVLDDDPATGLDVALIKDTKFSKLVFESGAIGLKQANNVDYNYRTSNTGSSISTTGIVSVTVGDTISYGNNATINSVQRRDIIITPKTDATSTNTVTGTATNLSDVVSGTGLGSRLNVGDFLKVTQGSNTLISQVINIANSSHVTLKNSWDYPTSTGTAILARHFPAFLPIPLDDDRVAANTNSTGKTLTVNLSNTAGQVAFSSTVDAIITFNVKKVSAEELHKNVNRNLLVKLDLSTHPAGVDGPWSLGVPDAFRLNRVFVGSSSAVNTSSTEITRYFYIDNGQKNDFYSHSKLSRLNFTNPGITISNWLLVEFDAFTLDSPTDAGFFTVESYDLASNNSPRSSILNTSVNILEIPEFRSAQGDIVDLRDSVDFRPRVIPTANLTSDVSLTTTNPLDTISFGTHDKLFPVPDSEFEFTYEYFLRRNDRVIIDTNGDIKVIEGVPATQRVLPPEEPPQTLTLGLVDVPPYPSLPRIPISDIVNFGAKKTGTDSPIYYKATTYTIKTSSGNNYFTYQPKRFTMSDIGRLERRIEDLEYYTNLSLLERKTKDLVIPSGNDPGTNRFKNGFFVDQFDDYLQIDTQSPESIACVNQEEGILEPKGTGYNFQCRFNYLDSLTRNNARTEESFLGEPGLGTWGEAVLTLPIANTVTVIRQEKFTSAVTGDGTDTRFVGDILVLPTKFKILINVEIRVTGDDAGPVPHQSQPVGHDDCKIICQKLAKMGFFDAAMNDADQRFGVMLRDNDPDAYNGYIRWAKPVVDLLDGKGSVTFRKIILFWVRDEQRRQKIQSNIVAHYLDVIARPWAEEMAFRMKAEGYSVSNPAGRFIMNIGLPMCRSISRFSRKNEMPMWGKTICIWGTTTVLLVAVSAISTTYKIVNKIRNLFKLKNK